VKPPRLPILLLIALLVALCCPAVIVASPAQAATGVNVSRLVYGDRMATLEWAKVAGATRYTVRYATNTKLKHPKASSTSATTLALKQLTNRKRYYMRVAAYRGSRLLAQSKVVSATPLAGYPAVVPQVRVVPGVKPNEIRVSWTPLQRATRVMVLAGADNQQTKMFFRSGWLPATATSTTLTVPANYRWLLGSGTGNAIYVKVGQYNSLTATQVRQARSDAAAYRLSNSNFYGYASTLAPRGSTQVRVASYNVQSVTASITGHPWSERRTRVAANIQYSGADLIGLQEATAAKSSNWQQQDIASLLSQEQYGGYQMAGSLPTDYRYDFDIYDAWFYYRPQQLTLMQVHTVSPRDELKVAGWPSSLPDQHAAWAQFRINATGATFYALNVHLPVAASTELKTREADALSTFIQQRAQGAPIVFMGDLNAAPLRDGYCASSKLVELGWNDTTTAPERVNFQLQTVNAPISYPTLPERALNVNKGRIDYILTRNMGGALRYKNQNVLRPDGSVDITYQGSDHNLQWADLLF
jgi:endonuclease/exonuclease/phosphatase family metal-dependent hydrolase